MLIIQSMLFSVVYREEGEKSTWVNPNFNDWFVHRFEGFPTFAAHLWWTSFIVVLLITKQQRPYPFPLKSLCLSFFPFVVIFEFLVWLTMSDEVPKDVEMSDAAPSVRSYKLTRKRAPRRWRRRMEGIRHALGCGPTNLGYRHGNDAISRGKLFAFDGNFESACFSFSSLFFCLSVLLTRNNSCFLLLHWQEDAAEETSKPAAKDANAPRFEIKKWNAVAMWSWDICADTVRACMSGNSHDNDLRWIPFWSTNQVSRFRFLFSNSIPRSAPFAVTRWMNLPLNTKQILLRQMTMVFRLPLVIADTCFIWTVSSDGSRHDPSVPCATRNGTLPKC